MPRNKPAICRFCNAPLRNMSDEICDDCVRAELEIGAIEAEEQARQEDDVREIQKRDEQYEKEYWEQIDREFWADMGRTSDPHPLDVIEDWPDEIYIGEEHHG